MLIVSGTFQIATDDIDRAKEAAAKMASATREEPGCVSYSFFEDIENPGLFRVFEEWKSGEDLTAHFEMPHMTEFRATLGQIEILSRDVKRYEIASVSDL